MSDKSPRKERVFGEPSNDPNPRMRGRGIVREGWAQGVSPMDVLQRRSTVTPGTDNLPNN